MLRPTPLVLFDQSLKTSFLSILSLLFLINHLQFKIWSISILNSTQWKLFGASLARTIQMELLCTATCILCIKCPLICNRNTRLKCRLRVPFSLASVTIRTWSLLAGNDLPDCNLRRSITSFQGLNHFFFILFEVYLNNDKSFLNCCNQLFCHRIPLVLAWSLCISWWNAFLC